MKEVSVKGLSKEDRKLWELFVSGDPELTIKPENTGKEGENA